jgi:hypothetical protein
MTEYEIVSSELTEAKMIKRTIGDVVSWIPIDESNPDYQQYLIDTDGSLPIPQEKSK